MKRIVFIKDLNDKIMIPFMRTNGKTMPNHLKKAFEHTNIERFTS